MANITELIKNIRNSIFGKDVRESIAGAIEQCYEDGAKSGNANMEVADARGIYDTLKKRLDYSDNVKADKTELEAEISTRTNADSNLQNKINGVDSKLQSQINTNKNAINVNSSRIDNITRLPDGSTTGDAELQDIRVGADGNIYNSAGEAVRRTSWRAKE